MSALASTGKPLTVAPSGVVQVFADAASAHMTHAAVIASAVIPFFGTVILPSPFQLKAMPKWMLVSVTTIRRECGERHYATPASVKNNFPSSQFFNGNFGTNGL